MTGRGWRYLVSGMRKNIVTEFANMKMATMKKAHCEPSA
jgi:hypothetical protein